MKQSRPNTRRWSRRSSGWSTAAPQPPTPSTRCSPATASPPPATQSSWPTCYADLAPFDPTRPELDRLITEQVEIQLKYQGYIARQMRQVEEFRRMESHLLPENLDYDHLDGLRLEAREKLKAIRPLNLGQASRISGVSPADLTALMICLEQEPKGKQVEKT